MTRPSYIISLSFAFCWHWHQKFFFLYWLNGGVAYCPLSTYLMWSLRPSLTSLRYLGGATCTAFSICVTINLHTCSWSILEVGWRLPLKPFPDVQFLWKKKLQWNIHSVDSFVALVASSRDIICIAASLTQHCCLTMSEHGMPLLRAFDQVDEEYKKETPGKTTAVRTAQDGVMLSVYMSNMLSVGRMSLWSKWARSSLYTDTHWYIHILLHLPALALVRLPFDCFGSK